MANGINPAQPEAALETRGAGKPHEEVSKGLMRASFGILGQAFAQEFGAPAGQAIVETGDRLTRSMQMRWWQKEQEDFKTMHMQDYTTRTKELSSRLKDQMSALDKGILVDEAGNVTNIDPTSEQANRMRDDLLKTSILSLQELDTEYMNSAEKYRSNPLINNSIQNLMASRSQMIAELTGPSPSMEREDQLAGTDLKRAQAENLRSEAAYNRSGRGAAAGKPKDFFKLAPDEQLATYGWGGIGRILMGTKEGRERLGPYGLPVEADVVKEIQDKYGIPPMHPDFEMRKNQEEERIMKESLVKYVRANFGPGGVAALRGEMPQLFPDNKKVGGEDKVLFPSVVSREEEDAKIEASKVNSTFAPSVAADMV